MSRAISTRQKLSIKKKKVFLSVLAQTGQVMEAAKAVGYRSPSYLSKCRKEDEEFAEEWAAAEESAIHILENEAWDRAKNGTMEPEYYKGKIVGYTPKKSDTLIMFLLRKLDPRYRDSHGRGGDTNINFGVAVMPMTAKNDEAWEARAVEMHGKQEAVQLEAKPVENALQKIRRGD